MTRYLIEVSKKERDFILDLLECADGQEGYWREQETIMALMPCVKAAPAQALTVRVAAALQFTKKESA